MTEQRQRAGVDIWQESPIDIKAHIKQSQAGIAALFIALRKKQTPWYAKAVAGFAIAYALSPLDLIPDFIPVLGYLDDLIILPLLIFLAIRLIPGRIMEECQFEAKQNLLQSNIKKWYFAVPVVLIWILAVILLLEYSGLLEYTSFL